MKKIASIILTLFVLSLGACAYDGPYNDPPPTSSGRSSHQH